MKKIITVVLAIVMVLSLCSISAFAAGGPDFLETAEDLYNDLDPESNNTVTMTLEDGYVNFDVANNNDPWLVFKEPLPIGEANKYAVIKYRTSNAEVQTIDFYIAIAEPHAIAHDIVADGEWHLAYATMDEGGDTNKWTGNGTWARFDMMAGTGTNWAIDVAWIAFFADENAAKAYTGEAAAPAGLINDGDYSVSYVIDKTNATSWAGGQIGDLSVTYFFNVKDDGLEVAVRAIGLVQDNLVQLNFNPGNKLWDTTGQFVSFKLGDTLTVLQHNHKNGLLDDDSAGGADITAKVPNQIVKLDNGYEFTAKLPKELFTITDVEGADSFVYGQDDLYFGMFLVAGGGGLSNQQNTDYTDWTCKGLALNQYKFAGAPAPVTEPETVPQTGDAAVAMFAVIAVLAMGAAVVFMKKRAF